MERLFIKIKNKIINKKKSDIIKTQASYNNIFNILLNMISTYGNDKTKDIIFTYQCLITDKIYFTNTKINNDDNIIIQLLEINFLKPIKKNRFTKNKICVECGKNHASHKYKNCGHSVNYSCALEAYEKDNSCNLCSKNIINNNKIILLERDTIDMCSICLENTNTSVHCGHFFHKECIEELQKYNNKCPYCRCILYNNELKTYNNVPYSFDNGGKGYFNLILKIY